MSIPLKTGNGFIRFEAHEGWTSADIAALREHCDIMLTPVIPGNRTDA